ncbi:hypothetical protein ENUP19_0273G0014 [Entamoeba nuttalli]|uniref:Uncharacterized protein n=1 Tax=Entamoeba nuttalli TaxID=412467 RepID=A0ABQ0D7L5_9EUKA
MNEEKPKKVVIVNGVIYDQNEIEQTQSQNILLEETNKIYCGNFTVNIYVLYLLIMILSILFLGWAGIIVGLVICLICGIYFS